MGKRLTTGWYDEPQYKKLKYIKILFWSAKRLDGNMVVKGLKGPLKTVVLKKNFDEDQKLVSIKLYFFNGDDSNFWGDDEPATNVFRADLATLTLNGDPTKR